jgi:hypothetical protein
MVTGTPHLLRANPGQAKTGGSHPYLLSEAPVTRLFRHIVIAWAEDRLDEPAKLWYGADRCPTHSGRQQKLDLIERKVSTELWKGMIDNKEQCSGSAA